MPFPTVLHSSFLIQSDAKTGKLLNTRPEFLIDNTLDAPLKGKRDSYKDLRDFYKEDTEFSIFEQNSNSKTITGYIDVFVQKSNLQSTKIKEKVTYKPLNVLKTLDTSTTVEPEPTKPITPPQIPPETHEPTPPETPPTEPQPHPNDPTPVPPSEPEVPPETVPAVPNQPFKQQPNPTNPNSTNYHPAPTAPVVQPPDVSTIPIKEKEEPKQKVEEEPPGIPKEKTKGKCVEISPALWGVTKFFVFVMVILLVAMVITLFVLRKVRKNQVYRYVEGV